jgi:putative chitinase
MEITLKLLKALCPSTNNEKLQRYCEPLNEVVRYYEIDQTPERCAGFLAQIAHESGGFNLVVENLNYNAAGLMRVFRKYFPSEALAKTYERKPEKIANKVYANRMGNGSEESGDGWRYRGRGLIQLTGKNNYAAFANGLGISLQECVAYMETPEGACASAGWFWDTNKLNNYCDKGDFVGLTKRINGGTNGLADRQHHYSLALSLLKD